MNFSLLSAHFALSAKLKVSETAASLRGGSKNIKRRETNFFLPGKQAAGNRCPSGLSWLEGAGEVISLKEDLNVDKFLSLD